MPSAAWIMVGLLASAATLAAEPGPRQCAVWNRDLAFAAAAAQPDQAALAGMIDADAVFALSSPSPLVGRAAIVRYWRRRVAGENTRLHWYPTLVVMPPTEDIAWSRGSALRDTRGADGQTTSTLSIYAMVWRRNADGEWRVVMADDGAPVPATAAQRRAFFAGQTAHCNED